MSDNNLKAIDEFSEAFDAAQNAAQIFEARLFELRLIVTKDAALRTEIDRILELLSTKLAEMEELKKTCNAEIDAATTRYENSIAKSV
jgi:hypothetical protein